MAVFGAVASPWGDDSSTEKWYWNLGTTEVIYSKPTTYNGEPVINNMVMKNYANVPDDYGPEKAWKLLAGEMDEIKFLKEDSEILFENFLLKTRGIKREFSGRIIDRQWTTKELSADISDWKTNKALCVICFFLPILLIVLLSLFQGNLKTLLIFFASTIIIITITPLVLSLFQPLQTIMWIIIILGYLIISIIFTNHTNIKNKNYGEVILLLCALLYICIRVSQPQHNQSGYILTIATVCVVSFLGKAVYVFFKNKRLRSE